VAPTVPVLRLLAAYESEIGFVDQRGGLQRMAGLLSSQLPRRQLAQLVVHQREKLLGGPGIALLDCGQDAGDFEQGSSTMLAGGISF